MSPSSPILSTLFRMAGRVAGWPFRVAANRATMRALAAMDRRELMDLGLTVSDLRDASALAPDRDPTGLLANRARERRRDAFAAADAIPAPLDRCPVAASDPCRPGGRRSRHPWFDAGPRRPAATRLSSRTG